jgi:hypothetical protein
MANNTMGGLPCHTFLDDDVLSARLCWLLLALTPCTQREKDPECPVLGSTGLQTNWISGNTLSRCSHPCPGKKKKHSQNCNWLNPHTKGLLAHDLRVRCWSEQGPDPGRFARVGLNCIITMTTFQLDISCIPIFIHILLKLNQ